jgi:pyruvate formate lyase activating enzyme
MTGEMLELASSYIDAANVDLKAFRDQTYRQYIGARLQPVLDSMLKMKSLDMWLEVTTLVIPGINDDPAELRDAAHFVAQELGVDTPWHLSRFFPTYKLTDVPPTPVATLQQAEEIGREEGLHHVYVGNVPGYPAMPGRSMSRRPTVARRSVSAGNSTFCHQCGRLLVRRNGYRILENHVQPGSLCPDCEAQVSGVGMGCQ